jgi:hypothetical protein
MSNATQFDIDIDFGDRDAVLRLIQHVPATIDREGKLVRHNTGVYVNPIPRDPFTGHSSIDYERAEELGYVKLDLLNVHVYNQVRDEAHLDELILREPYWEMLRHREFVEHLIHLNNHFDTVQRHFPDTLDKLAMVLAIIRPSKRYLIGRSWREIAAEIWTKPAEGYFFKRAHAYGYAQLVWVHMNLLTQSTD